MVHIPRPEAIAAQPRTVETIQEVHEVEPQRSISELLHLKIGDWLVAAGPAWPIVIIIALLVIAYMFRLMTQH